jgi:hypothetical protein
MDNKHTNYNHDRHPFPWYPTLPEYLSKPQPFLWFLCKYYCVGLQYVVSFSQLGALAHHRVPAILVLTLIKVLPTCKRTFQLHSKAQSFSNFDTVQLDRLTPLFSRLLRDGKLIWLSGALTNEYTILGVLYFVIISSK